MPGVLLCCSPVKHIDRPPWPGSYSVDQGIRRLMGQPLCCSAANAGMGRERLWGWFHPPRRDLAVSHLASMAARFSSTSISHHNLLSHISSTAKSSPSPGIAPQSLNSSSQPLHLPGNQHSCLGYVYLQQGLSDSHSI